MSKYTLVEGAVDTLELDFESSLFNKDSHRHTQASKGWRSFSWVNEDSKRIEAQIHFHIADQTTRSPYRAPFGSLDFASGLAPESLALFIQQIEQHLRVAGVKRIIIKDRAHQHDPQRGALTTATLLDAGFQVVAHEINSGIVVDERAWEEKISHAERKRLRRCKEEQLEFYNEPPDEAEEVYQFIDACRRERDMSLSMTWPQLKATFNACPDDFYFFSVFQNGRRIAASISIKVDSNVLYDFYHAHEKASDSLSPVVLLIDGMYLFCRQNHFRLLDLGTSAIDGKINFSLLNFKQQIGGEPSLKLTFAKDLT